MNTVTLTKGLPASGKTTFAKELVANSKGKCKRISKDDLRAMLDNGKWSKHNEEFIIKVRDMLILEAINNNYDLVVDDTNLAPKHFFHITDMVKGKANVEVKDFTDVPLEACIARDQKRQNYVGEKVILEMYNRYLKPEPQVYDHEARLPLAIMCDLDGTLALFGKNNPYERDFFQDEVNKPILNILNRYSSYGAEIIIMSGRNDKYMQETLDWLTDNKVPFGQLHMRKDGDTRKDFVVKQEMFNEYVKDKSNVLFVLDDRNQVVDLWRNLGLTCLQVADGEF